MSTKIPLSPDESCRRMKEASEHKLLEEYYKYYGIDSLLDKCIQQRPPTASASPASPILQDRLPKSSSPSGGEGKASPSYHSPTLQPKVSEVVPPPKVERKSPATPPVEKTSPPTPSPPGVPAEFSHLEHALYDLQNCRSPNLKIDVSVHRSGEKQDVAVNSTIKGALATPGYLPSEKATTGHPNFGPLERVLRELQNYSTPIQSLDVDASLQRKGSERTITLRSKTVDQVVAYSTLASTASSSTEKSPFWKRWNWKLWAGIPGIVVSSVLAGYLLQGKGAEYRDERTSQLNEQKLSVSATTAYRPTLTSERESVSDRTYGSLYGVMGLAPHSQLVPAGSRKEERKKGQCLKSFRRFYTDISGKDAPELSLVRPALTEIIAACRTSAEISKVLTASKDQVRDYFDFPGLSFEKTDAVAEEWKKSFRRLFGKKALLYSGNPHKYQSAVHRGYTPLRFDPIIQKILQRAGVPTDEEIVNPDLEPVIVNKNELSAEEKRMLSLIPRIEAALFLKGKTALPPTVKIYSALHDREGKSSDIPLGYIIMGYYSPSEPTTIYLRRDCLQNEERFIKTYTHERGHQVTNGFDYQDVFRQFFEDLGYQYLRKEILENTMTVTVTHGRKQEEGG